MNKLYINACAITHVEKFPNICAILEMIDPGEDFASPSNFLIILHGLNGVRLYPEPYLIQADKIITPKDHDVYIVDNRPDEIFLPLNRRIIPKHKLSFTAFVNKAREETVESARVCMGRGERHILMLRFYAHWYIKISMTNLEIALLIWHKLRDENIEFHPNEESNDFRAFMRFSKTWEGTIADFCRRYRLDMSNFAKWRRGMKLYPSANRAIRDYATVVESQ
jgi:hypothetical protein